MGFTAGAVHQLVDAAVENEVRRAGVGVQQMRRPFGDADAVDQQVVADDRVQR